MEENPMKTFNTVMKILAALAAVAGAVYIIATYGDKIVAWAKKLLNTCPCQCDAEDCADCCCDMECPCDVPTEEAETEEAPVAEPVEENTDASSEEPVIEATVSESEPVADEHDFAE